MSISKKYMIIFLSFVSFTNQFAMQEFVKNKKTPTFIKDFVGSHVFSIGLNSKTLSKVNSMLFEVLQQQSKQIDNLKEIIENKANQAPIIIQQPPIQVDQNTSSYWNWKTKLLLEVAGTTAVTASSMYALYVIKKKLPGWITHYFGNFRDFVVGDVFGVATKSETFDIKEQQEKDTNTLNSVKEQQEKDTNTLNSVKEQQEKDTNTLNELTKTLNSVKEKQEKDTNTLNELTRIVNSVSSELKSNKKSIDSLLKNKKQDKEELEQKLLVQSNSLVSILAEITKLEESNKNLNETFCQQLVENKESCTMLIHNVNKKLNDLRKEQEENFKKVGKRFDSQDSMLRTILKNTKSTNDFVNDLKKNTNAYTNGIIKMQGLNIIKGKQDYPSILNSEKILSIEHF